MHWLRELTALRYQAEMLGNDVLALEALQAAQQRFAADVEAGFHLRAMQRWLLSRLEQHHDPSALLARLGLSGGEAALVTCPGIPPAAVVGVCQTVLLDSDQSRRGFVAQLSLRPLTGPASALSAALASSFSGAIQDAEDAVLQHLLAARAGDVAGMLQRRASYALDGPPAARAYLAEGRSIGAAAAVAIFSHWCQLPVPAGLFVTGALDAQGAVGEVEGLAEKLATVFRERPGAQRIILPRVAGGLSADLADTRLVQVGSLAELLAAAFGAAAQRLPQAPPLDIEALVRQGIFLYEKQNDFHAAEQVLRAALETIEQQRAVDAPQDPHAPDEFAALWRLGSALLQRGAVEPATEIFLRAEALGARLWETGVLDPQAYLGFRINQAVLLRDAYQYARAEASLQETLALQQQLRQSKRELARTWGCLGELWSFMGKLARAEEALSQALCCLRASYPQELPRAHCNLGNLYLRQLALDRARESYRRGLRANQKIEHGQALNAAFLYYGLARVELALGRPRQSAAAAAAGIALSAAEQAYPRQLLLACQGLALIRQDRWEQGQQLLLQAGELGQVEGSLLRFGMATALGHLALAWLEREPHPLKVALPDLVRTVTTAARAVPGLSAAARLEQQLAALLLERPLPGQQLSERLEELLAWFPYGIEPDHWRGAPERRSF